MNAEWIQEMSIEDLPAPYQELARIIGIENAVKLSAHIGGMSYYFPKLDQLIQKKRDEAIRREFNGTNHRELARKYGLTEIWIRQIVQNGKDEKQASLL